MNDEYWDQTVNGRWIYMSIVINELKIINPNTVLELGAYKINLTDVSDNMDLNINFIDKDNFNNRKYIQDASTLPYDIADKYYDVFIGLQVFEHLNNQSEIFKEIERISKYAILSFPYKWDSPDDILHHNLDHDVFKKWTNNKKPYRVRYINDPISRKRVIYMIKF